MEKFKRHSFQRYKLAWLKNDVPIPMHALTLSETVSDQYNDDFRLLREKILPVFDADTRLEKVWKKICGFTSATTTTTDSINLNCNSHNNFNSKGNLNHNAILCLQEVTQKWADILQFRLLNSSEPYASIYLRGSWKHYDGMGVLLAWPVRKLKLLRWETGSPLILNNEGTSIEPAQVVGVSASEEIGNECSQKILDSVTLEEALSVYRKGPAGESSENDLSQCSEYEYYSDSEFAEIYKSAFEYDQKPYVFAEFETESGEISNKISFTVTVATHHLVQLNNAHMKGSAPQREIGRLVMGISALALRIRLNQFLLRNTNLNENVILAGDFNTMPSDPQWRLLWEGSDCLLNFKEKSNTSIEPTVTSSELKFYKTAIRFVRSFLNLKNAKK